MRIKSIFSKINAKISGTNNCNYSPPNQTNYEGVDMASRILSQERLKYLFEYDSITGNFTRLTDTKSSKKGSIANTLDANGYVRIKIDGYSFLGHRLAYLYYYGYMPIKEIDHINGIRSDNRLCNLREATRQENLRNQKKHKTNTSGYKGVSWASNIGKWCAKNRDATIGYFETKEAASLAHDEFVKANHGIFNYKLGVEK
jgi:hypothetical protein